MDVLRISRIETFFDLELIEDYNFNRSKFVFYKQISNVFPLDYKMLDLKTDVLDLKDKKITINISNPLLILKPNFNTLNKLFGDEYMPTQILDISCNLLSTFSKHDFKNLKYNYLTDHIPEKFIPEVKDTEVKFYFKGIKEVTPRGRSNNL